MHGNRIGDIGHAIESYVEPHGYGIVRELVGHGLGRELHETPPETSNYGRPGHGKMLGENSVIAIETMANLRTPKVVTAADGGQC